MTSLWAPLCVSLSRSFRFTLTWAKKHVKNIMQQKRITHALKFLQTCQKVINCKRASKHETIIMLAVELYKSIIRSVECTQNGFHHWASTSSCHRYIRLRDTSMWKMMTARTRPAITKARLYTIGVDVCSRSDLLDRMHHFLMYGKSPHLLMAKYLT